MGRFEDGFVSTKCTTDTCWKDMRVELRLDLCIVNLYAAGGS